MHNRINILTTLVIISCIQMACNESQDTSPPEPLPHFSLSNESYQAISNEGCTVSATDIACPEIPDLSGIKNENYPAKNASQKKRLEEKRLTAIEKILVELKAKSQKAWSLSSATELHSLELSAISTKVTIISRISSLDLSLLSENSFFDVSGYSCSAEYGKGHKYSSKNLQFVDPNQPMADDEIKNSKGQRRRVFHHSPDLKEGGNLGLGTLDSKVHVTESKVGFRIGNRAKPKNILMKLFY